MIDTETGEITEALSVDEQSELVECEAKIERGLQTFYEVGEALLKIRDGRLYRETHSSFEAYCGEKWQLSKPYAHRLIAAVGVIKNLVPLGTTLPVSERLTRPLRELEPEQQREVWQGLIENTPNGEITTRQVEIAVQAAKPSPINTYDDDGNVEYEYRYKGGYAYCKYCYETHNHWQLVDFPVWECEHCDHRTNDKYMQLVSDEDGQRYDLERRQREKQESDFLNAMIEEKAKRDNSALFTSHTDEWNTPQEILRRVLAVMGEIDLDPCSNSEESPNVPAALHYTEDMNGLAREWRGRVYMNPPYGDVIGDWAEKLVSEYRAGRVTQALALVPARTDTQWFRAFREFPRCFIIGRLKFGDATNSATFPSVVISLGCDRQKFMSVFGEIGDVYELAALND